MRTWMVAFALLSAAGTAAADVQEPVVVVGAAQSCADQTPAQARWIADKAAREGEYQRAGECYLVAGEHSLADQAFVRASAAQSKGDTSRRLASNLTDIKASARQMKQAFQHR